MKYDAIVFDLGNTLVSYFSSQQWRECVFGQCLEAVERHLLAEGFPTPDKEVQDRRVAEQRSRGEQLRFHPLADRLGRVFGLGRTDARRDEAMAREFLGPVFARARLHDDVVPTLRLLRQRGAKTGILSNTPWGSPAALWREELARHGLDSEVDAAGFCEDAGYRKPAPEAFHWILRRLGTPPERTLFVGDDPRWDVAGPRAVRIEAVLIERAGPSDWDLSEYEPLNRIRDLRELMELVE